MKKIAYISSPHFADCDAPLIQQLKHGYDLMYILKVSPSSKQKTLLQIGDLKKKGGIYSASEYEGLEKLFPYIELSRMFVVNMPGNKDMSPCNLWAIFLLFLFLLRNKIDIIHLTWPLRYGEFLLYILRKRMILTVHDPFPHSSENNWKNRFHRFVAFRLIHQFILLNQSQYKDFISHYRLKAKNVYISRLGIYSHLQQTSPQVPKENGYVLFIGTFSTHKGIDILCRAMQKVHQVKPETKLVLAGSGKIYFDITPYINQGFVILHNHYLTDEELVGFIRQAAFVVCPYIDATQSGVIMSAFALNIPVIATDVGGLPEMVTHKVHGLLVPPRDFQSLASAIDTLLSNPSMLEEMKVNIIRDYHEGKRPWKHIAEEYSQIYQNMNV